MDKLQTFNLQKRKYVGLLKKDIEKKKCIIMLTFIDFIPIEKGM